MRIAIPLTLIALLSARAAAAQRGPYGPPQPYDPGPQYYDPQTEAYGRGGRGPGPGPGRIEAVYAIQADRNGIRVRVSSNGCTRKQDFQAQVARSYPSRITLIRRTPDRCRSFAQGSAWLTWSYNELRITAQDEFTLANPLTAWTGPGN